VFVSGCPNIFINNWNIIWAHLLNIFEYVPFFSFLMEFSNFFKEFPSSFNWIWQKKNVKLQRYDSFGCTIFWKIANIKRICFLKLCLDGLENLRQNSKKLNKIWVEFDIWKIIFKKYMKNLSPKHVTMQISSYL